jgi:hypothetical protein
VIIDVIFGTGGEEAKYVVQPESDSGGPIRSGEIGADAT